MRLRAEQWIPKSPPPPAEMSLLLPSLSPLDGSFPSSTRKAQTGAKKWKVERRGWFKIPGRRLTLTHSKTYGPSRFIGCGASYTPPGCMGQGDQQALDQLTPLVYKELRRLAQWHMNGERPGHTLQATALVNEAYLQARRYQPDPVAGPRALLCDGGPTDAPDSDRCGARSTAIKSAAAMRQKVSLAEGLVVPDRPEGTRCAGRGRWSRSAQIDERRGRGGRNGIFRWVECRRDRRSACACRPIR